jgi:hypothetical protein
MEVNMSREKEHNAWTKAEEVLNKKGINRYDNYKQFLTMHKKLSKAELEIVNERIKRHRKNLKKLVEKYQTYIDDDKSLIKEYKRRICEVDTEYSYRKKISHLIKKYDFIDVEWEGDYDMTSTWVWHKNDEADEELFGDSHVNDTYEEAYNACLECIEWTEKNSNIKQTI